MKIHDIAKAQQVPPRFLEGILNQLRHAGFVASRRGSEGGYTLALPAREITIAAVVEVVAGNLSVAPQNKNGNGEDCVGGFAFDRLWSRVDREMNRVLGSTSIADLVDQEQAHLQTQAPDYNI